MFLVAKPCQISRKAKKPAIHISCGKDKISNTSIIIIWAREEKDTPKRCCGTPWAYNISVTKLAWWLEKQATKNRFCSSSESCESSAADVTEAEGHSVPGAHLEWGCGRTQNWCYSWGITRPTSDYQLDKREFKAWVSLYDSSCR